MVCVIGLSCIDGQGRIQRGGVGDAFPPHQPFSTMLWINKVFL